MYLYVRVTYSGTPFISIYSTKSTIPIPMTFRKNREAPFRTIKRVSDAAEYTLLSLFLSLSLSPIGHAVLEVWQFIL